MNITINEKENQIDVVVKGDVEMMTIKEFKEKLFNVGQTTNKDIILDLSEVDYIDSSGVGVLISLLKLQNKKGKEMRIQKVSANVMNVLQLSSLSNIFNFS